MSDQQKRSAGEAESASDMRVLSQKDFSITVPTSRGKALQDFAVWVRVLRQNWRQGTVGCKGRSDVARTTKKPWKQKGTGRARAGSPRSPLWRGGGVTFGPQARVGGMKITQGQKRGVMAMLCANYLGAGKVVMVDRKHIGSTPKTSRAKDLLQKSGLTGKKITLLIQPKDSLAFLSFRNIPGVSVIAFDQPNAFHLVNSEYWMVLNDNIEQFKTMVAQWS